MAVVFF